jgi:hypothetical protein
VWPTLVAAPPVVGDGEEVAVVAVVVGGIPLLHHWAWWVEHIGTELRPLWVRSSAAAWWALASVPLVADFALATKYMYTHT